MDALMNVGQGIFGGAWPAVWTLLKIVLIVAPLMLGVAYLTYFERKVIGYMQVRIGPNRVGPLGLIQPIADGLKLLLKEIVVPSGANKGIFIIAPMLAIAPALAAWAVIPFTDSLVLANIDASLLYIMAITSMGVYGIILSGWASNSKYAFLGAMRSAAQMVSYEVAMGFSLICVLMVSNSLNLVDIVNGQGEGRFAEFGLGFLSWNWLPLLPMFVVYLISGTAELNRAPFDLAEGESEIVAGFHVEYSGMAFALFFLAEYANMIIVAGVAAALFLGGWQGPFLPGVLWFLVKIYCILFFIIWLRWTYPRVRFDQLLNLSWKWLTPLALIDLALAVIVAGLGG